MAATVAARRVGDGARAGGRSSAASAASARSAGPAASSSVGRAPASGAAARGDGGGVLAVERAAPARARGAAGDAGGVEQRRRHGRQGEVEREPVDAERGQRLGRRPARSRRPPPGCRCRSARRRPGQLAFRGELGAAHPQHLAGIAEPQRPRRWPSRVAAMRATCGVMSARRPIMRWLTGSIRRKVCSATRRPSRTAGCPRIRAAAA